MSRADQKKCGGVFKLRRTVDESIVSRFHYLDGLVLTLGRAVAYHAVLAGAPCPHGAVLTHGVAGGGVAVGDIVAAFFLIVKIEMHGELSEGYHVLKYPCELVDVIIFAVADAALDPALFNGAAAPE